MFVFCRTLNPFPSAGRVCGLKGSTRLSPGTWSETFFNAFAFEVLLLLLLPPLLLQFSRCTVETTWHIHNDDRVLLLLGIQNIRNVTRFFRRPAPMSSRRHATQNFASPLILSMNHRKLLRKKTFNTNFRCAELTQPRKRSSVREHGCVSTLTQQEGGETHPSMTI